MADVDVPAPPASGTNATLIDEKMGADIESLQRPPPSNAFIDGLDNASRIPFEQPTPASKPSPPATLTPDQAAKYTSLLSTAQSWTEIHISLSPKSPKSPLTDSERMWLTRECLLRYLRASKWNLATAATRLQSTLSWRREWGVEAHTAEYISPENETGKQVITGYDNQGRPCLYLNPHKQNTKGEEKQMQHLVFMLERCIDLMPPGQETLALLVNFRESRRGQSASIAQGRQTIYILQNHYPERLGRALVQEVPRMLKFFFTAISAFIDPATREKMKFDQDLRTLIPPEQLIKAYGGDVDFVYEHEVYWPAFIKLTEERRALMVQRWEEAGKRVGESEAYLKGEGKQADGGVVATEGQTQTNQEVPQA